MGPPSSLVGRSVFRAIDAPGSEVRSFAEAVGPRHLDSYVEAPAEKTVLDDVRDVFVDILLIPLSIFGCVSVDDRKAVAADADGEADPAFDIPPRNVDTHDVDAPTPPDTLPVDTLPDETAPDTNFFDSFDSIDEAGDADGDGLPDTCGLPGQCEDTPPDEPEAVGEGEVGALDVEDEEGAPDDVEDVEGAADEGTLPTDDDVVDGAIDADGDGEPDSCGPADQCVEPDVTEDTDADDDDAVVADDYGGNEGTVEVDGDDTADVICIPKEPPLTGETLCDGLDDDCNGTADDFAGVGTPCFDPDAEGVCKVAGVITCDPAQSLLLFCNADKVNPQPELCNLLDDDCNGLVDDFDNGGEWCLYPGVKGSCLTSGVWTCDPAKSVFLFCDAPQVGPQPESCNGLDDDCDGFTDEELGQQSCGIDPCEVTVEKCVNGILQVCTPKAPPDEKCNGLDDDCDGIIDNGFALNVGCTVGVGECESASVIKCSADGFSVVCDTEPLPQPEAPEKSCDGLDNDCDGFADNIGNIGKACTIGLGICATDGEWACDPLIGPALYCDAPASPVAPGIEECNELDDDCDGKVDEVEDGLADNDKDAICDSQDPDDDNDGLADVADNCQFVANPGQQNIDGDGLGDVCDADIDNDGKPNAADNCQLVANAAQEDQDQDGLGDVCDDDVDGDTVPNAMDNCPVVSNPSQSDFNSDKIGDSCQDSDGDGTLDATDNCLQVPNVSQNDWNGNDVGDACEDADGNGTADILEYKPACTEINSPIVTQSGKIVEMLFEVSAAAYFSCEGVDIPLDPMSLKFVSVDITAEKTATHACEAGGYGVIQPCDPFSVIVSPMIDGLIGPKGDGILANGNGYFKSSNKVPFTAKVTDPNGKSPLCTVSVLQDGTVKATQLIEPSPEDFSKSAVVTAKVPAEKLQARTDYSWYLECNDGAGGTLTSAAEYFTTSDVGLKYWARCDEGIGSSVADSSGAMLAGAGALLNESGGNIPTWVAGISGTALFFDKTGGFVDVTADTALNFGTGDFTMSAWIKSASTGATQAILDHRVPGNGWEFYKSSQGYFGFYGAACGTAISTTQPANNSWHFVAAARANSAVQLYIDGALAATNTCTDDFTNDAAYVIGCNGPTCSDDKFDGVIDDVAIYHRALSGEEILAQCKRHAPTGTTCQ